MKVIPIKGTIVSNNDRWLYDWLEWDATAPKDVVLPESGEPIEVHINSGGGDVYAGSEIYTCLLYTSPSPRDTERSRMPSSA